LKINVVQIPDSGLNLQFSKEGDWFSELLLDKGECDFTLGRVDVSCSVNKVRETIVVEGTVETVVGTDCSRCLEPVQAPLKGEFRYVLVPAPDLTGEKSGDKFGAEKELNPDEVDCGYYEGEIIDLDPLVFEQIVLQIPLKALCGESCKGLCPRCGTNLNTGSCDCPVGPVGGKFAALKNFKVNK
jgi:uncharacterized protein